MNVHEICSLIYTKQSRIGGELNADADRPNWERARRKKLN